jgi:hypothetical protein
MLDLRSTCLSSGNLIGSLSTLQRCLRTFCNFGVSRLDSLLTWITEHLVITILPPFLVKFSIWCEPMIC